jgi:hypothetical protein
VCGHCAVQRKKAGIVGGLWAAAVCGTANETAPGAVRRGR